MSFYLSLGTSDVDNPKATFYAQILSNFKIIFITFQTYSL